MKIRIFTFVLIFVWSLLWPLQIKAAVTGQIVIDPQHKNRMIYQGVTVNGHNKPVILCGPGDPEEFFFINTQNNLNMLKSKKAKITYIMAWNQDKCSGTCGPPANLDPWVNYLDQMEDAGITPVFIFFDDGIALAGKESTIASIVNKLKNRANGLPRKLLIWSVAEEFEEKLSVSDVNSVANIIKNNDANGHIIAVHQLPGTAFKFNNDSQYPNLQMFMMQLNVVASDKGDSMHTKVLAAFADTQGDEILNMAEDIDHALDPRINVRQRNWSAILGGASIVQVHQMGRASDPGDWNNQAKYDDCNFLTNFMEQTRVNFMTPNDGLKAGGTEWVLAEPGFSYILYARNATSVGLTGMTAGTYKFTWLGTSDSKAGTTLTETKSVGSSTQSWTVPASIGSELALYIVKTEGNPPTVSPTTPPTTPTKGPNSPPQVQNTTVSTPLNQPIFIQLTFTDNDGPGPYTYSITQLPAHGSLSGTNNDRTYNPSAGYFGVDTFKWTVNDSQVTSNVATVTINVTSAGKPGDANNDNKVDGLDYVIWLNNYGKTVTGGASKGDFNTDGKVDGLDYVIWLTNYGK